MLLPFQPRRPTVSPDRSGRWFRWLACGVLLAAVVASPQILCGQEIYETPPVLVSPVQSAPLQPPLAKPLNLHLVVTEGFLNSIVSRAEAQSGEVRDQFEDTPVAGQQMTATQLRLDLQPSPGIAAARLILEGETTSTTTGFSPQAAVNSIGRQNFRAGKDIFFNGWEISTRHAEVAVRAESRNVGAVTKFSGRPLGPLVEHVVLSLAEQRQPQAQAFARQRVIERVYPQFDGEIDANLAKANDALKETVQPRLKLANLLPERMETRTSDEHLHLAASLAVPPRLTQLEPAPAELMAPHAVSLYLHESLFNGLIERSPLAGMQTSTGKIKEFVHSIDPAVPLPMGGINDLDIEIQFAERDPVEVRIGNDETVVILRATFRPPGQTGLPEYELSLRYRMELINDNWVLKVRSVTARAAGGTGNSVTEIAVGKLIETSLPVVTFPKAVPAESWLPGKRPPEVTSIRSGNGWLVIGLD